MSEEQNNELKKSKQPRHTEEDGIRQNDDNTYDVRVSRRIKIKEGEPSKQFFKRAKRVSGMSNAIKKRREMMDALARLAQQYEGTDLIWADAIELYDKFLSKKLDDKKIVRSTYDNTMGTLRKHTKHWNTMWLSNFTSELVENYINSGKIEVREEKEARPATRINVLKFIRGVFHHMVNKGRMKHNPAKGIYVRGKKKLSYPAVMTHNEMVKLIDYVGTVSPDWSYVYTVAYLTGARSGELYSLTWDDVKWDSKTIQIKRAYDWKTEKHQEITKGKKDRTVPMNKTLVELLLKKRGRPDQFVLPRIPEWKSGRSAQVIKAFQRACGVRETKFHGIRGTFITNLLLQGIPVIKVQTMVGHDDLKTTIFYLGMIAEETKGATEVLSLTAKPENVYDLNEGKKKKKTS